MNGYQYGHKDSLGQPLNVSGGDRVTVLGWDYQFEIVSIRPEGAAVIRNLSIDAIGNSSVPVGKLTRCRYEADLHPHTGECGPPPRGGRRALERIPHLAVGEPVRRHDLGDEIARQHGVFVAPVACGQLDVNTTLTTRRTDRVRCECCRARMAKQPAGIAGTEG